MVKVIKTEGQTGNVEKLKGGWGKVTETLKNNTKRNLIILCTIALIGGAVYLNWVLFSGGANDYVPTDNGSLVGTDAPVGSNETPREQENSYFAMALLNRETAYDNAYDTLLAITTSAVATEEAKESAYNQISAMAANIQTEANIETLIKAKGFKECVAVISDGCIDIIVQSDGLVASEVAQIREIVLKQSDISPANITIIERKS